MKISGGLLDKLVEYLEKPPMNRTQRFALVLTITFAIIGGFLLHSPKPVYSILGLGLVSILLNNKKGDPHG